MGMFDAPGERKTVIIKCVCGNEIEFREVVGRASSVNCARCGKMHKGYITKPTKKRKG
jgi:transposase